MRVKDVCVCLSDPVECARFAFSAWQKSALNMTVSDCVEVVHTRRKFATKMRHIANLRLQDMSNSVDSRLHAGTTCAHTQHTHWNPQGVLCMVARTQGSLENKAANQDVRHGLM